MIELALDIHEKTFNDLLRTQEEMFPPEFVKDIETKGNVGQDALDAVAALSKQAA